MVNDLHCTVLIKMACISAVLFSVLKKNGANEEVWMDLGIVINVKKKLWWIVTQGFDVTCFGHESSNAFITKNKITLQSYGVKIQSKITLSLFVFNVCDIYYKEY